MLSGTGASCPGSPRTGDATSFTSGKTLPRTDEVPRRVLIYLLGSLGDTLVAVPALRLVARRFPEAERRVLTTFSINEKAAPMAALLDGTGLVDGYFRYPPGGTRDPRQLVRLLRQVRRWKPDLLIYMHEARGSLIAARDATFFKACGIRRMIGMPYANHLKSPLFKPDLNRYEHRTEFLARRLSELGDSRLGDRTSWDLALSGAERDNARAALAPLLGCEGIITASIGTKVDVNDWGDDNWKNLLQTLSERLPGWGLAMIGAPMERARTSDLLSAWHGKSLNLCGSVTLRECGAVLALADLYVGHDSGPMHLAAAVGTPCVAVFSARNYPGPWFPYGEGHKVFYHQTECFGCHLAECPRFNKKCILSIGVNEVADAVVSNALATAPHKSADYRSA